MHNEKFLELVYGIKHWFQLKFRFCNLKTVILLNYLLVLSLSFFYVSV